MPNSSPQTSQALYDGDIRWPLHEWLKAQHADDPETRILHELKLPRHSARVDLAVINGEIAAFEIKSDVDSLTRLSRQVLSFNKVFDKVCVVTTARHKRAIVRKVPPWWGISIVENKRHKIGFTQARPSAPNPEPDLTALLHTLHINELLGIIKSSGIAFASRWDKLMLISAVSELNPHEARIAARTALRTRHHSS